MKTIVKILLVPIAIGLVFAIVSCLLWCVGSLLLLVGIDFFFSIKDSYDFWETALVGGIHLLGIVIVLMILLGVYDAIDSVFY